MQRLWLALVCFLVGQFAFAQDVVVVPSWTTPPEIEPRSTLNLVLQIENNSESAITAGLELDLPDGWRRLVPDLPMEVPPESSSPRIVALFVPLEAEAGDYRLAARVVDSETSEPVARTEFEVTVLPHVEIQLDDLDGSTYVLAGEFIEVPFRVANRSNTAVEVDLSLETRSFYSAEFDGAPDGTFVLEPREAVRIVARIRTPPVISRVENYIADVVVVARPVNGVPGTGAVEDSFRTRVEIIPVASEEAPPFYTIPARITASTAHAFQPLWSGAMDLELFGRGFVDPQEEHKVEFRIAPSADLDGLTIGSVDDTYRLNYSNPWLNINLGDNAYAISPVLGAGTYGRGASVLYTPGLLSLGGVFHTQKTATEFAPTAVALVGYQVPDPSLEQGFSYRGSLHGGTMAGDDIVASTYHQYVTPVSTAALELAGGTAPGYPFIWAAHLAGSGKIAEFDFGASAFYAGPGFSGPFTDQLFVTLATGRLLDPSGVRVDATASYRQERLTAVSGTLPQTIVAGVNANVPLSEMATNVRLAWKLTSRQDLSIAREYGQLTNSLTAATRLPFGGLQVGGDVRFDLKRDSAADEWTFFQRYNAIARYRPDRRSSYDGAITISSSRSTGRPIDRQFSVAFATSNNWAAVETEARAGISVLTRDGIFSNLTTDLAMGAYVSVFGNHTISVDGHALVDVTGPNLSGGVTLNYTAPFRIPTVPRQGIGSVEGYAYDELSGEPSRGVVLRASDRAVVTSDAGLFRLTSLLPGEYYLDVDTSRVGRRMIPNLPVPIKISVAADEITEIDMPLVQSASITGKVVLYETLEKREGFLGTFGLEDLPEYEESDLVISGGLPNTVVHISRDDEVRRVLTRLDGTFALTDIRPGLWTVSIATSQLPRYHRLVQESIDVLLEPASSKELELKVFPIRRPVQLLLSSDTPIPVVVRTRPEVAVPEGIDVVPDTAEVEPLPSEEPSPEIGIQTELARRAVVHYSRPIENSPRLLSLPWGASPETVARLLVDRIDSELSDGAATNETENLSIVSHAADGRFLLGLAGSIDLAFLDLGEYAPQKYLVDVTLRFNADENFRTVDQMEQMHTEMLALFFSRWKTGVLEGDSVGEVVTCYVTMGDIEIRYEFDNEDGSIEVQYRDDWFERAEASIIESRQ